jgi:type VI secretion system secreted protein Hcp
VQTTASATTRGVAIGLVLALLALMMWSANEDTAAANATPVPVAALDQVEYVDNGDGYAGLWFAKYDGIDGESIDENHSKWINILEYEWGLERAEAPLESRRRGTAEIEPLVMRFDYEKAAPKLLDKCAKGEVIPKLEVELTMAFDETRPTYLRYEMKNVVCTAYQVGGIADGTRPDVLIANEFEEIKVTYTEFDDSGAPQGNVETTIKVEG